MTATDELRRLLDERGIKYEVDEDYGKKYPPEQRITWSCDIAGEDMTITARDYCVGVNPDEYCLDLEFHEVFTPQQAIEATLGRGECHPIISDNLAESEGTGDAWADCSECGHLLFVLTDPNSEVPHYCPNCGAKVVSE